MRISQGGLADVGEVARLLWLMADDGERSRTTDDDFTADLSRWWAAHQDSHAVFLARLADETVGMAWVALLPRVPRPGLMGRTSADIQSVFVMPQHRGRGIGSAVVNAAFDYAIGHGGVRVTVHSGSGSVPLYERLGFESSRQLLERAID